MILESIVVAPRWSAASSSIISIVVLLLVLELLSQAEAVLHLVFGVLVKRAWAIEDLLVLFVVVALGVRLTNDGDDVVWLAAAILARLGSFWPITTTVTMIIAVVETEVIVASVVEAIVVATRWAMSARILVEAHLGFLNVDVLVGSSDHLADACGRLAAEFGAKLMMVESSDESGDDLSLRLKKASNVVAEELRRLLVDAVEIMLGAQPSTCGHIIVGEDFF